MKRLIFTNLLPLKNEYYSCLRYRNVQRILLLDIHTNIETGIPVTPFDPVLRKHDPMDRNPMNAGIDSKRSLHIPTRFHPLI